VIPDARRARELRDRHQPMFRDATGIDATRFRPLVTRRRQPTADAILTRSSRHDALRWCVGRSAGRPLHTGPKAANELNYSPSNRYLDALSLPASGDEETVETDAAPHGERAGVRTYSGPVSTAVRVLKSGPWPPCFQTLRRRSLSSVLTNRDWRRVARAARVRSDRSRDGKLREPRLMP